MVRLILKQIILKDYLQIDLYLEYKYLPSTIYKNLLNISESFDNVFSEEKIKEINIIDFGKIYTDLFKLSTKNIFISDECKGIIESVYLKFPLNDLSDIMDSTTNSWSGKDFIILLIHPETPPTT